MEVSDRDKSVLWPYTLARNQNLFEKMKHQGLDSELMHLFFFFFTRLKNLLQQSSCLLVVLVW